jgi:uroporphyrinogen III methyltransferase/synthase
VPGIVYLVGAGPGDPGLLTRRAAELLERADVVAHDRLVHPDVLKLARKATLVDVGKQPGESGSGQARINELIVAEARAGRVVVRLKGGDPFVFGRGGEEAEVCASAGIPFEVVPGVTSAVAGPAYAGIPLTHRDHASWAAIATGHEDPTKDATAIDWQALARAPTAVFLMGIARLANIVAELTSAGREGRTPAAVVAWATWPQQRVVRSTLDGIVDAVRAAGVKPPAILVVGDVVSLPLDWFARRPLAGKRVFVTRTRAQAGSLSSALRELGAEALEFPAIRIRPPASWSELDGALVDVSGSDWVVFTSTNAVDAVWERLNASGRDARAFSSTRIAAVGSATAESLRSHGLIADLVPPTFTSEALATAMGTGDGRLLIPQAVDAPREMVDALTAAGWRCTVVPAYRTEIDDASQDEGRRVLDEGLDAVLFTSATTVRNFVKLWGTPPDAAMVCCIGPRTAEAAAELGVRVDAVADTHTIEGLVATLVATVGR